MPQMKFKSCSYSNKWVKLIETTLGTWWIWQYGLSSFQAGYTKLERFLPKNQHTQRKALNFENWVNGEVSKSAKVNFLGQFSNFNNFLWICWFKVKIFSILYPPLENSTTRIAILTRRLLHGMCLMLVWIHHVFYLNITNHQRVTMGTNSF